jgi:Zn-dependent peptidase ImmA (M78 family)
MASIHTHRGAKRAREARKALGLHPAEPLRCLLTVVEERCELPVVVARLPDGVAGACYRKDERAMLWVNGAQAPARQRFTLAHELGHVRCDHDGRVAVDSFATLNGSTTTPREVEANAFAAEFLMPAAALDELLADAGEPALDHVVILAAGYGTSALAALFRLVTAGCVGPERADRMRAEIEAGDHLRLRHHLGLELLDDRLAGLTMPYWSPRLNGRALAALR